MRRFMATLGFTGIAVSASSMASAATVFQDSFSGDVANTGVLTAGTPANYPAVSGTDVGLQWVSRTPATSATNNPIAGRQWSVQVRSDDPVTAGNQYLALHRNTVTTPLASGGTFGYAHAQLSAADTAFNAGKSIKLSSRIYIGSGDLGATVASTGELMRIIGQEENTIGNYNNDGDLSSAAFTNGTFGVRIFRPATGTDIRVTAVQGGGLVNTADATPLPNFKLDEWNTLTVNVELGASTPYFTYTVANSAATMTSAQQKIWTAFGTTIGTLSFYSFNDVTARVDDVLVTSVPEPTGLALLGAAASAALRRRRR